MDVPSKKYEGSVDKYGTNIFEAAPGNISKKYEGDSDSKMCSHCASIESPKGWHEE